MDTLNIYHNELTHIERVVLKKIQSGVSVLMIPVDIYASILWYSEVIEDYETCNLLNSLIDKVKLKTSFEFYDEYVTESFC